MNLLDDLFADIDKKVAVVTDVGGDPIMFADSSRTETDFVPEISPKTIVLRGYQKAAVEYILKHRRAAIGLAPGLGKSIIAATAIANIQQRTVIVCPPNLITDPWTKEFENQFPDVRIEVAKGQKPYEPQIDTQVLIVPDSVVSFWAKQVCAWKPEVLCVDEVHRHKNPKSKRGKGVLEIAQYVQSNDGVTIVLSGTLAVSNATEVFMPSRIANMTKGIVGSDSQDKWNRKWSFGQPMMVEKKMWANGRSYKKEIMITVYSGCKDPEGLHDALRHNGYFRVEREDVTDMPPKQVIPHSTLGDKDALKEYRRIKDDFERWYAEQGKDPDAIKGSEKLVQLQHLQQAAAIAKVGDVYEQIESLIEQGEQVVVMAHHISAVEALKEVLQKNDVGFRTFVGSDSRESKDRAVDDFKSGRVPVLIGNIKAAGVGLNLENACNLIFLQLPWTPADFEQASDRIYRLTQTRTCNIHVPYIQGTVDQHMLNVLEKKAIVTDGINAGKNVGIMEDVNMVDEVFALEIGEW